MGVVILIRASIVSCDKSADVRLEDFDVDPAIYDDADVDAETTTVGYPDDEVPGLANRSLELL